MVKKLSCFPAEIWFLKVNMTFSLKMRSSDISKIDKNEFFQIRQGKSSACHIIWWIIVYGPLHFQHS